MTPSDVHTGAGGAPGRHRIVYDQTSRFVCSETRQAPERRIKDVLEKVRERRESGPPLGDTLSRMLGDQAEGRPRRVSPETRAVRADASHRLLARARSPLEGEAAVFAVEAWAEGIQVVFVGAPRSSLATT